MSKQFPIPTRPDRFVPPIKGGKIAFPAAMVIRDGVAVTLGDSNTNPMTLAKPDGNCCCNDEILGCSSCEHFENEYFDDVYFDCNRLQWLFDDAFTCDIPNDQTVCCRTFLPTPFANVQMQTSLGDYFFPNSCFSMRVYFEPFIPPNAVSLTCCIGVVGLRWNEPEGLAETMTISLVASGGYTGSFENIPCDRITDNRNGDGTAIELGYSIDTNITQWENVTRVTTLGAMACAPVGQGSFGNACKIKATNGDVIAEVNESSPINKLGFDPPFTWLFKQFFDSTDYLDSSFTTQFQIATEGVVELSTEHTNEPC